MKPLKDRFESKIEKTSSCWLWIGSRATARYYGRFWQGPSHVLAHRFSYQLYKGEIPLGLKVLHKCDVTHCVNPDHLFLGTQKENIQDMDRKGRRKQPRGEKCGASKITAEQAIKIRNDPRSMGKIGKDYGVSTSQVCNIKHMKHWRHV